MSGEVRQSEVDRLDQVVDVEPRDVDRRTVGRGLEEQRPGTLEVAGDAGRVAADIVDVGGRDLDQALEEGALGAVVGAHPGRFEVLVGLEEVTPLVGGQPAGQRRGAVCHRQRAVRLRPPVTPDDDRALGHASSASGRRPENPVSRECQ